MTIADEISDLKTNTQNIKTAIENAGGTTGNTGLSGVASEIATIPSGGGDPFDGHGPVSEIDRKYAEMEMTFEVDTHSSGGEMMETLVRSMKLDGEYLYEWEEYQTEDWSGQMVTAYRKKLKDKFSDIKQVKYLAPIELDLANIVSQLESSLGWVDMSQLGNYLDFRSDLNSLRAFPKITLTSTYDPATYGYITLPDAFFFANMNWDCSELYSNSTLIGLSNYIIVFVDKGNGNTFGTSSDNPIDFTGISSLENIEIRPRDNSALYIGNLASAPTVKITAPLESYAPSVNFLESQYSSVKIITGVNPDSQKFPNQDSFRYVFYNQWNDGRTPYVPYRITLPNLGSSEVDCRGICQAVGSTTILLSGGSPSMDFRDAFSGSHVQTVNMSELTGTSSISLFDTFRECRYLTSVTFPAVSFSFISRPFVGCFALNTLNLSNVASSSAVSLANNMGDVPKSCAITVIDQAAADAFTAKGFTNVTVAS